VCSQKVRKTYNDSVILNLVLFKLDDKKDKDNKWTIFFLKKRSWFFEKKTLKVQNWIEIDKKKTSLSQPEVA